MVWYAHEMFFNSCFIFLKPLHALIHTDMQIYVSHFNNVYLQFWQFLHSFTAADVLTEVQREGKWLCKDDCLMMMFRNVSNVCWGSGGLKVREASLWSEKWQNFLQCTDNRSLTWLCCVWNDNKILKSFHYV